MWQPIALGLLIMGRVSAASVAWAGEEPLTPSGHPGRALLRVSEESLKTDTLLRSLKPFVKMDGKPTELKLTPELQAIRKGNQPTGPKTPPKPKAQAPTTQAKATPATSNANKSRKVVAAAKKKTAKAAQASDAAAGAPAAQSPLTAVDRDKYWEAYGEGGTFSGDGTAYSPKVENGKAFACSFRTLSPYFKENFAAINEFQWNNGTNCGRCAVARCVDVLCKTKKPVHVMIVDRCPECKHGDLDFSYPTYNNATGLWPHRLKFEWRWANCGDHITGSIKLTPKDGSNPYWRAFFLSNSKQPIKSVKIGGQPLETSQFGFHSISSPIPQGKIKLQITSANDKTVTAEINDLSKTQDLKVNF